MGKIEINKNWLYSMNDKDMIGVYELVPRRKDIIDYKRRYMERIPTDKKYLYAISDVGKLLDTSNDSVCLHDVNYGNIDGTNYHIIGYDDPTGKSNLIRNYYNGSFDDRRVLKVFKHGDSTMYLLLTEDYTVSYINSLRKKTKIPVKFKNSNILSIPSELAMLQTILQGNYKYVDSFHYGEDIDGEGLPEILSLFDLKRIDEFPLRTFEYSFTTDSPEEVIERIKDSESTYQKIKTIREGTPNIYYN